MMNDVHQGKSNKFQAPLSVASIHAYSLRYLQNLQSCPQSAAKQMRTSRWKVILLGRSRRRRQILHCGAEVSRCILPLSSQLSRKELVLIKKLCTDFANSGLTMYGSVRKMRNAWVVNRNMIRAWAESVSLSRVLSLYKRMTKIPDHSFLSDCW